jgi:TPR repeat protein
MDDKLEIAYDYYAKDNDKAYALFLECAKDNYVDAQIMVASMLYDGVDIDKNLDQSYYWYKRAADNGHIPSSKFYADYCFDNNNFPEGQKYLEKAVNAEDINAIYNLAIYYLNGKYGYEYNEDKALTLFEQAVHLNNDVEAYANVGRILFKKLGKDEAFKYMRHEFGFMPIWKSWGYCMKKFFTKNK